ncbi:MAG TPA: hypothetical protein VMV55_01070 [Methanoregula sp.]|nr:hypothetical protein [Methanoregula sp.]
MRSIWIPAIGFILMAVGFILATGCVAPTNNDTMNATPATTSAPVTNTSDTGLNITINATTNITSELKGSLKVSISGISYPASLSVLLDNEAVGMVNSTTPLYLMVSEGNHTVMVCDSSVCKHENVTTRFGRYVTADFSQQLQKDVEFPDPTVRILEYYKNGNVISVKVEFINPSTKDLLISVVVSCRYSYIDDRTLIKREDYSTGMSGQNVKAGQRTTEWLDLYFASGNILSYDSPVIKDLEVK